MINAVVHVLMVTVAICRVVLLMWTLQHQDLLCCFRIEMMYEKYRVDCEMFIYSNFQLQLQLGINCINSGSRVLSFFTSSHIYCCVRHEQHIPSHS